MPMKDFSDLKSLREQLKGQDEARARDKAEREERERVAAQEANLFKSAIGGVRKMPESNRFVPNAPPGINVKIKPAKVFRNQAEDDAAVLRESLSDQFEVDHLLEDDPSLSFSRAGIGTDVVRKLRKGHWPVQDELDLHGLRRDGARDAIGEFLHNAGKRKLRCVCVIHGKGLGSAGGEPVLRSMVHSWLEQKEEVIAFCAANVDGRSHGALIVLLKSAIGT
ncbi:Smr/MutS family protein [Massilia scottii]|uniref:Smr/MutS family protein n=1 Tax=Massilia scottii TaxID=3057166 RepID=UPI0027969B4B|nr:MULTISPECIES: Smr/MutS family protein [unclassified Massilia]MDQ1813316.1 Smr/MutS family protein [Massilia sp. CCM 9210]MDQ1830414.1 Smr/MutS family protein [Massilia sp. CCM 9029]